MNKISREIPRRILSQAIARQNGKNQRAKHLAPAKPGERVEVDTACWQIGEQANVAIPSKMHIWRPNGTMMLCGAKANWRYGNFGHDHSGRCTRCFNLARKLGYYVRGQEED